MRTHVQTWYKSTNQNMVLFKQFRPVIWWIVAIAALNWALFGVFDINLITDYVELSQNQYELVYMAIGGIAIINMYNMAYEMGEDN